MGSNTPLNTVLTTIEVLEILERERGIGPAELARQLGVTRPTAYSYLSTLTEAGYARNEDGTYYISYRILGLGSRLKYRNRFFRASKVPLRKLVSDVGNPVYIGVEESGEWVILHRDGDITSIDIRTYPGLRLPLHTHAAGKVVLAEMDRQRRDEVLDSTGLDRLTEKTVTDRATLEEEIERIREQGYAVSWDQQAIGVGTVARPVVDEDEFLGTISIATVTATLQDEDTQQYFLRRLKEAGEEVVVNYRHM